MTIEENYRRFAEPGLSFASSLAFLGVFGAIRYGVADYPYLVNVVRVPFYIMASYNIYSIFMFSRRGSESGEMDRQVSDFENRVAFILNFLVQISAIAAFELIE